MRLINGMMMSRKTYVNDSMLLGLNYIINRHTMVSSLGTTTLFGQSSTITE
ncbi:hypothetical protein AB9N12_02560 [Bacteroides sp. AN502(2024)]|uniref:hypothetical protein n=1 Tax=Bacteroides sp. AN502(2024) TaxID=3160599 RepID=UPI003516218C